MLTSHVPPGRRFANLMQSEGSDHVERREEGSRVEDWPWKTLLLVPGGSLFLPPGIVGHPSLGGLGIERWPALERLTGLGKALRTGGVE